MNVLQSVTYRHHASALKLSEKYGMRFPIRLFFKKPKMGKEIFSEKGNLPLNEETTSTLKHGWSFSLCSSELPVQK